MTSSALILRVVSEAGNQKPITLFQSNPLIVCRQVTIRNDKQIDVS